MTDTDLDELERISEACDCHGNTRSRSGAKRTGRGTFGRHTRETIAQRLRRIQSVHNAVRRRRERES